MTDQNASTMHRDGDVVIATLNVAELTTEITSALAIDPGETPQLKLILDLSRVKFMNSVALGGLVVLLRHIKQNHGRLAVVGLSGHCRNVMEVTGLQRVFELYDTIDAARAALDQPL